MLDRFTPISTTQYEDLSKKWESLLMTGESVCVIFPYLSDRQIRIRQYIDSIEDLNLIPVVMNLSLHPIDEIGELKNYVNQQLPESIKRENLKESLRDRDETVVLVIPDGEILLKVENEQFLTMLQNIILEQKNIRVLTAFESNIYLCVGDFNKYNLIFQNIFYYPLYKDEEVMKFVGYLCKKWQLKMPQPIRKSIAYNSGGFFWLVKEACRTFRENGSWGTESPTFQLRLNSIVKSLSKEEKVIICNSPRLKGFENSLELKHLRNIGLINADNLIRVPGLVRLIKETNVEVNAFQLDNEEIIFRGIALSGVLSVAEYSLLRFFIQKPNIPISRDEIAKILWPSDTENRYSEWAIDQAIKRLRDRLVSFRLPPTIIRSVRGIGYEFRA